jgi:hypothetical protein
MPNDDKNQNKPVDPANFDPAKPLNDSEDEAECQRRFQMQSRLEFLKNEAAKSSKTKKRSSFEW